MSKLGPFKAGVDNRRESESLWNREDGAMLRAANNVDITDEGKVRRRAGFSTTSRAAESEIAPAQPLSNSHSSGSGDIFANAELRDTMNPQPRDLSCKHFGRYVAAVGDTLWFSDLYLDGDETGAGARITADRNFVQFAAPITAVFSTGAGLYVSADETFYLPGDVASTAPQDAHPTKIIRGSVAAVPNTNQFVWLSTRGPLVGEQNGKVDFLAYKHLDTGYINPAQTGATLFRVSGGLRQIITTLHGEANQSGASASDYMDAEIVRKGTDYGHH